MNGSYGSERYQPDVLAAVRRVVALRPDLVLLDGDMVAGQRRPALGEADLRGMWKAFHDKVSGPLARAGIAVAPSPGNHDASSRAGFELERRIYEAAWSGRRPDVAWVDGRQFPFFYAFEMKGVLFVGLDATKAGLLPSSQFAWLSGVLDDRRYTTKIVFSHMPLWPVSQGRESEVMADPRLKALFERTGVSLHVAGHHHAFFAGESGGVVYVTSASLGGPLRKLIGRDQTAPHGFTMIEVAEDGAVSVSPLVAPDFEHGLDPDTLPERIVSPLGTLTRLDLAAR